VKDSKSLEKIDLLIIGGGASGMAAAISAKLENPESRVVLLEKLKELGKKIRASGNGRCNISNKEAYGYNEVREFLAKLGIFIRESDEGRMYPFNEDAKSVVSILEKKLYQLGVIVRKNATVTDIKVIDGGFNVQVSFNQASQTLIKSRSVLIATGGKSMPKFGTTGDGFVFARKLGLKVMPLIPVLTSVEVKEDISLLQGIRAKCRVSLFKDGSEIQSEKGEIQFTKEGISGICVFNLSRFLIKENDETLVDSMKRYKFKINFIDGYEELDKEAIGNFGESLIRPEVMEYMKKIGGGLYENLTAMELSPFNLGGWNKAQLTRGGVALEELDGETMATKNIDGLFFAGEVIDRDFACGGFNLNHSWLTGKKSGKGAIKFLRENFDI